MIAFAQTCLAREGSDDAAAAQEALRVVEHGASMLRAQGGHAAASQAARLLRFKAALHLRVHDSSGAVEALEEVAAMGDAGLCERGAWWDFQAAEEHFTGALKEAEAMDGNSFLLTSILLPSMFSLSCCSSFHFTAALNEAEAMDDSSDFNPMVGAVLSLLGDTYAQRGRLQHTGEGMIAEGLFRRALALLGAAQWDNLDHRLSLLAAAGGSGADQDTDEEQLKDQKNRVLQLDLIAFTLERYAAALQAFPMRASEAQSMSAAAHHLWRSPLSLDSAVTSSRVSAAALEPMMKLPVCAADNPGVSSESESVKDSARAAHFSLPAPVVDVTTGRVLLS
ncbi:unnamed protein product [Closterium sp. Yama58-4]|nr:unnamed protein product [Closterium sp. Yama58-4]